MQGNGSYDTSRKLSLNELILPRALKYKLCDHHLFEVLLVSIQAQKPLFYTLQNISITFNPRFLLPLCRRRLMTFDANRR